LLLVYACGSFYNSRQSQFKERRMRQQFATTLLSLAATFSLSANLAWSAEATAAQAEPAPATSEDVENITVTGQRPDVLRRQMMDFVLEIGNPIGGGFGRGYARWRDKVCVGVHNLTNTVAAQYIADRISAIAADVGLEPGEPGCRPNLNVIFSNDGRALATRLTEASPTAFRPYGGEGGTTQGLGALEEFKTSEAPVRWWQVTMIVDELGLPAIDISNGLYGPPVIRSSPSLIKTPVSDDIWTSYVIVDASKLGGAQLPQLTDYIAMVSLAQIDPHGLPASDTILNLFTAERPPGGLTDIDRNYLHALYSIDTMIVPRAQRGMLARAMVRARLSDAE
jgi:hypothetical protein